MKYTGFLFILPLISPQLLPNFLVPLYSKTALKNSVYSPYTPSLPILSWTNGNQALSPTTPLTLLSSRPRVVSMLPNPMWCPQSLFLDLPAVLVGGDETPSWNTLFTLLPECTLTSWCFSLTVTSQTPAGASSSSQIPNIGAPQGAVLTVLFYLHSCPLRSFPAPGY